MKNIYFLLICAIALSSCGNKNDSKGGSGKNGLTPVGGASSHGCNEQVVRDASTEGCRIRLVSPTPCQTIDLTGGKHFNFLWEAEGNCEMPFIGRIGGNPLNVASEENVNAWQLHENPGIVSPNGGVATVTAADIEDLKSTDGTFHWLITSSDGSHPSSIGFKVKR